MRLDPSRPVSRRPHYRMAAALVLGLVLSSSIPVTAAQASAGPAPASEARTTQALDVVLPQGAASHRTEADTAPLFVLVRHAEKADDDPRDPGLTPEGRERAAALAALLGDAGVTRILSSDYRRTRQTAGPLAERTGVEVELYDPRQLDALASELRQATGVVVVVGHSNTTPGLVQLLGGDPGPPLPESEYDRLYVLSPDPDGTARTLTLRFGAPSG